MHVACTVKPTVLTRDEQHQTCDKQVASDKKVVFNKSQTPLNLYFLLSLGTRLYNNYIQNTGVYK